MKTTLFFEAARAFFLMSIFTPLFSKEPKLKEGDEAPGFTLDSTKGGSVSLKDFIGKKVVLYFYPKDNTPG